MLDVRREALQIAVKELIDKEHFDICRFDQILKLSNITIPEETYQTLRILHCINYSKMPESFRIRLKASLIEMFSMPTEKELIEKELNKNAKTLHNGN